jgi:hypothetical protein
VGAAPAASTAPGGLADFARKLRAAWQIFFPPQTKSVSPKEEGKNRLRMILVADRCAHMPPGCAHDP